MQVFKNMAIACSILFMAGCAEVEAPLAEATPTSVIDARVDEYFLALTGLQQFNGTVIVKRDDEIIHLQAYNLEDIEMPTMAVDIDSQFDLRSVSKLFAQVLILQLEKNGRLSRADAVSTYIPDFPNGAEITLQHLLDHQSGLPREFVAYEGAGLDLSPDEVVELAKKEPQAFAPGSDSRYSNIGYQLLYYIIGQVTDQPFSAFAREGIFDPVGMAASGGHFFGQNSNLKNYAYGHELDDGEIEAILEFEDEQLKMGTLYSTAPDLGRLLGFLEDYPELAAGEDAARVISHAGGSDGKRAYVETNLDLDYSFAFLTNYDAIPFAQIVSDIRSIVEGKPYTVPEAVNRASIDLSEDVLEPYVGVYEFAEIELLRLEFRVEDGLLTVYQDGEKAGTLMAETETVFFEDKTSADSFEFKQGPDGEYVVLMDWRGANWTGTRVENEQ